MALSGRSLAARISFLRNKDRDRGFFGISSGKVRMSITAETGDELILWDLRDGMWFGSTTLVDNSATSFDARALVDSEVVEIPRSVVKEIAEEFPGIYKYLFADQAIYTHDVHLDDQHAFLSTKVAASVPVASDA